MAGKNHRSARLDIGPLVSIWLMIGVLWFPLSLFAQPVGAPMFTESVAPQANSEAVNPEIVIRQRLVEVRFEALLDDGSVRDVLQLNLFEDVVLTAVREHIEIDLGNVEGGAPIYTWVGYVEGMNNSEVILVFEGSRLSGTIELTDGLFQIRNSDNGQHVIRELVPAPEVPPQAHPPVVTRALNHSSALEREVFDLTNRERAIRGLHELTWDSKLARAARGHARDMAEGSFHSHTGSDGSSAGDRMSRAGYTWSRGGEWWENIAAWSAPETARAVINRWMNSSGHRASILRSTVCDLGVGHVGNARSIGSRYDTYWTQNFGRLQDVRSGHCQPGENPAPPDDPKDNAIDTRYYYRLTNAFLGRGRALDTYSNTHEPFMARARNVTGQYWKLTPLGSGFYRLTNRFLGDRRALDTYSDTHEPFMARARNVTGQYWKLTPVGNGRFRLTNRFLGSGRSLDTYSDSHEPFMGRSGNFTGQFWRFEKLRLIDSN